MSPVPALTKQKVGIPVYALDWLDNATVVATGGGGAGKFGVANRIIVSQIQQDKDDDDPASDKLKTEIVAEYPLSSKEDAPMTLAATGKVSGGSIVTGINQAEITATGKAQNKHLRIFDISSTTPPVKISPKLQRQVFSPTVPSNSEHYQRQTRFNRIKEPNLLAIASTSGDIAILSYPALDSVYSAVAEGDVYDLDFSPADNDMIVYITTKSLHILPFRNSKRVRLQNKKQLQELQSATFQPRVFHPSSSSLVYRCARFLSATTVLCALNDRSAKRAYLQLCIVNIEQGWRQLTSKILPNKIKAVVGMDVNRSRRMVALATNDMSLYVLHMDTFATLKVVTGVADFAITQVKFNPEGSYIACSSVANTLSFVRLEPDLEKPRSVWSMVTDNILVIIGLLLLLCLLLVRLYL